MKKNLIFLLSLSLAALLPGQGDNAVQEAAVKFSNPGQPGVVEAHLMSGEITVEGHSGKEVLVTLKTRGQVLKKTRNEKGMFVIENRGVDFSIEEENNRVEINTGVHQEAVSLFLKVPLNTSLELRTLQNGNITIQNVRGEFDVNNLNGSIEMTGVSGTVIAHSLNGSIRVIFDQVNPDKPMSFSTLNGKIDITLPADSNFDIKLDSRMGKIYSDFDLTLESQLVKEEEDTRKEGGKYEISWDRGLRAKLNRGGPEIMLKTMNGNIYIRSKK